jgi:lipopolysaccharide heptosyltransferase II
VTPQGFHPAKRILISSQMGIGNMVLFLPFLQALRQAYPNAYLGALFSFSNGADLLLGSVDGLVDEVIVLNLRGKGRIARILSGLKAGLRGWDMTIIRFNGVNAEVIVAALAGRSKWRVGHSSTEEYVNRWNNLLNVRVEMEPGSHEVDRYLTLATGMNIGVPGRLPLLEPPPALLNRIKRTVESLGSNPQQFIVLVPGTSRAQQWKRWPELNWVELVRLLEKQGIYNVLTGSADEAELCRRIIDRAGSPKHSISLAGKCSLIESIALCDLACVVVCCDSGLMHLSAAVNTPVIALFGPTDETRTGPLGDRHVIMRANCCRGRCFTLADPHGHTKCNPEECMTAIEPGNVYEAILKKLELASPKVPSPSQDTIRFKLRD